MKEGRKTGRRKGRKEDKGIKSSYNFFFQLPDAKNKKFSNRFFLRIKIN